MSTQPYDLSMVATILGGLKDMPTVTVSIYGSTPDITFESAGDGGFYCYDRNIYEGAQAETARGRCVGHGATPDLAQANYRELLQGLQ